VASGQTLISDSFDRAWRNGVVNVAIGAADGHPLPIVEANTTGKVARWK
jgi:F420-0:gamma-glutamyl ligase